jgi:predicted DNA-binding ribbon-helix-helix protein
LRVLLCSCCVNPVFTCTRVAANQHGWRWAYNVLVSDNRDIAVRLSGLMWTHLEALAGERGISISDLAAEALSRLVQEDARYLAARERAMKRLRDSSPLTLDGTTNWTRDELHER